MIDHILLQASNPKKSKKFYQAALKALGIGLQVDGSFIGFGTKKSIPFWLVKGDRKSVTKNTHIAFSAKSRKSVDKFYEFAMKAGGKSEGKPGIRSEHGKNYYAAYVLDPDGNNIEAVCYKNS
jgi:catechol 2,3-dioxygenase-like lactoylglutathione lyase family enzyme